MDSISQLLNRIEKAEAHLEQLKRAGDAVSIKAANNLIIDLYADIADIEAEEAFRAEMEMLAEAEAAARQAQVLYLYGGETVIV